ncbi:DUF2268 domain-containing putative Zn-dependent protease [Desulfosporosinus sp. PR]|uniref:DUF2268 domain-containing putative Zn-dependent protease n=1 Tax=Candidatus Desulfosporosinus nitrosoreducens TaxID=3401928 RepID=UPI0027E71008|nr:DUF2268 domain-containing putative Zn-dependent protease [Desulfosporosinus sp. PR]MDQ7094363.1 DUF2268 domain-containing putative Zn-dependent protease [Desulfosporosinus sp. PR]
MINWIWKYREFITAYDKSNSENDWFQSYVNSYLMPNIDLLNGIYFRQRGFATRADILGRMDALGGKKYFEKLRTNIGDLEKFEESVKSCTQSILSNFKVQPGDLDFYIIIGLDVTNIYSTAYQGENVTVLCLEAANGDISNLRLLLSHECHHWLRGTFFEGKLFGNCVGERVVTEGLAINFSESLFPGNQVCDYCYVPEATVNWVTDHWNAIDKVICEEVYKNDNASGFFTRHKTSGLLPDEPPRIGYVYGYLKVKEYLEKVKSNPIDLVGLSWEKVFFRPSAHPEPWRVEDNF